MPKKIKIILIFVSCLLLVVSCVFYYLYQEQKSEVVFFDVGQGDAILINLPGNNEILIDGGPDMTILYKLGRYLPIYNRDIELMILTHPHSDHLNGLLGVLERYQVKQVLLTGVEYQSDNYEEFIKQTKFIQQLKPEDNKQINIGEYILNIFYPQENLAGQEVKNLNNSSIVLQLVQPSGKKIMFMGDAEKEIEDELLKKYPPTELQSALIKVSHHGSNTASQEKFLQAIKPQQAIISVGINDLGLPTLRVIRRLERLGIKIFRTDELGDIIFKFNND